LALINRSVDGGVKDIERVPGVVRSLRALPLEPAYVTGTSNLFFSFYLPCLSVATKYDRAVGFFRSSLFVTAGLAFSDFARRGAFARIVCSHQISEKDAEAVQLGMSWREITDRGFLENISTTLNNAEDLPVVQLLATLIATRALELRVAVRPSEPGIFHDKVGIFQDIEKHAVSFVGSANETLSAWDPRLNHEGFEVFRSWAGDSDLGRVERHKRYFEDLWAGRHPGVLTMELPRAAEERLLDYRDPEGIESAASRVLKHLGADQPSGHGQGGRVKAPPPTFRVLQEHQRAVVENWEKANCKGIIAHVTGAGKTVSALEIVRRWTEKNRPALIIVPSELLLNQWQTEIPYQIDEAQTNVLAVGGVSGKGMWEAQIGDFTRPTSALGPRIIVATVQSASKSGFISKVHGGNHLLVVADEVHRVGAPGFRSVLGIKAGGTLGLSATPERFGDPEGTKAIHDYFGVALEPKIGIGEAVELKRLVPYDYFVHRISLSDTERTEWDHLSLEIGRIFAALPRNEGGARIYTNRYRLLLIRRARIIKQASGKASLAKDILGKEYKQGDRWLVYCDNIEQLTKVANLLRAAGLPVYEYHSAMEGSRSDTMLAFSTHGGVLVAIKCLDEGVDIPALNKALILASSSNPREFIQRRGRVLRVAPNKFSAAIHDALVLPEPDPVERPSSIPSYVRTDLARAVEFAAYARNTAVALHLRQWAADFGLTKDDLVADSYEDDEEASHVEE